MRKVVVGKQVQANERKQKLAEHIEQLLMDAAQCGGDVVSALERRTDSRIRPTWAKRRCQYICRCVDRHLTDPRHEYKWMAMVSISEDVRSPRQDWDWECPLCDCDDERNYAVCTCEECHFGPDAPNRSQRGCRSHWTGGYRRKRSHWIGWLVKTK